MNAMESESYGGIFLRSSFGKMSLKEHVNVPTDNQIPGKYSFR